MAIPENDPNAILPTPLASRIAITTDQDLIALGSFNLLALKYHWQEKAEVVTEQLNAIKNDYDFIASKTLSQLQKVAATYQTTLDTAIGGLHDQSKQPSGSTTLNFCGWCQYGTAGSFCRLWYDNTKAQREGTSPCLLTHTHESAIDACRAVLLAKTNDAHYELKHIQDIIDHLTGLIPKAASLPLFPVFRPCEYFAVNQKLICFLGTWSILKTPYRLRYLIGHVTQNCGACIVNFDLPIRNDSTSQRLTLYPDDPWLLDPAECSYFYKRPDYFHTWLQASTETNEAILIAAERTFPDFYESHRHEFEP